MLGRGAGCRLAANIAVPEWTPSPEQALSETPQALQGVCRPPRSHLSPGSGRHPEVRPWAWGTWSRTCRQGLLRAGPAAAGLAWGPLAHTPASAEGHAGLSQEAGLALGHPHKTRQSAAKTPAVTQSPAQAHTGPARRAQSRGGLQPGLKGPASRTCFSWSRRRSSVTPRARMPRARHAACSSLTFRLSTPSSAISCQRKKEEAGDLQRAHPSREGLCCLHTHTSLNV